MLEDDSHNKQVIKARRMLYVRISLILTFSAFVFFIPPLTIFIAILLYICISMLSCIYASSRYSKQVNIVLIKEKTLLLSKINRAQTHINNLSGTLHNAQEEKTVVLQK